MAKLARQVKARLPDTVSVVVFNFTPQTTSQTTQLGVYLAKKFSNALFRAGVRVRSRELGRVAVEEEMKYTVDRPDARELLKHFQADYAVMATYGLRDGDCALELVEVAAVPTTGSELDWAGGCLVKAEPGEFEHWAGLESRILPNMSRKLKGFLTEDGSWDVLESPRMVTKDGAQIPSNGEVVVGTFHKFWVKVKQSCHLYVLGWDQTNSIMTVLFPDPARGENSFTGVGDFCIPSGNVYAHAIPPAGYNGVRFVATKSDIGLRATGQELQSDPTVQDAMVDKILSLGPDAWGAVTFSCWIKE